jgi:hypothetical protein
MGFPAPRSTGLSRYAGARALSAWVTYDEDFPATIGERLDDCRAVAAEALAVERAKRAGALLVAKG